jgi:hypothetical protein
MSTMPAPAASPQAADVPNEIRIVSHSTLFYWWPIWAVGFLMALISWFSPYSLAVVPRGSKVFPDENFHKVERDVLALPSGKAWLEKNADGNAVDPHLYVGQKKEMGVLFCVLLLLVITITNVPMRGLWSVIVIMLIISLCIIISLIPNAWDRILHNLDFLDIRINMGGYMLISLVLFVLWLIVMLLFDRQIYMVFKPGQLVVKLEIGDQETVYDSTGASIQKQRSDLFRHWILGFGSGDLIVKTAGAQAHTFDMPNVLFLGRRVREIEDMLRARPVVSAKQ